MKSRIIFALVLSILILGNVYGSDQGLVIRTNTETVSLGSSFVIEASVSEISGSSGDIAVGDMADAYLTIRATDMSNPWTLYLFYDNWGNVNFTSDQTPLVSYWPLSTFDFIPIAEIQVPDDQTYIGSYGISGYMVQSGASLVDVVPSATVINVVPGGTSSDSSADDHGDYATQSSPISLGEVSGNIEEAQDIDYFNFVAQVGETYTIYTTLGTLENSYIYLYDTDGTTEITHNDDYAGFGLASKIDWTCEETGTYYIAVRGYSGDYNGTYGLFLISYTATSADDHGNNASAASPITVGTNTPGVIEIQDDVDFFSFTANAGIIYTINTVLDSLNDSNLKLYGSDGTTLLEENDDGAGMGFASRIDWTCHSSGVYYIAVSAYNVGTGSYMLTLSLGGESVVDDHGNTHYSATEMTRTYENGNIEVIGDIDYFSFEAVGGDTYHLYVTLDTLSDSYLYLFGTDGTTIIAENDNYEASVNYSKIEWLCPESGVYYLAVRAYGSSYFGSYIINAYNYTNPDLGGGGGGGGGGDQYDDHGDSAYYATLIRNNQTLPGNIEVMGDVDVFTFYAHIGQYYRIDVHIEDYLDEVTFLASLEDPVIKISNEFGAVMYVDGDGGSEVFGSDDDCGDDLDMRIQPLSPVLEFICAETGFYELYVRAYEIEEPGEGGGGGSNEEKWYVGPTKSEHTRNYRYTGKYYLSINDSAYTDDHANTPFRATATSTGTTFGTIDVPGDFDYFKFWGVAGSTYHFNVTGRTLQKPEYKVLKVVLDDATIETTSYGGGTGTFEWSCPESDFYYVKVKSTATYDEEDTGSYDLTIVRE